MKTSSERDLSDADIRKLNELAWLKKISVVDCYENVLDRGFHMALNQMLAVEREKAGIKEPQPIDWSALAGGGEE